MNKKIIFKVDSEVVIECFVDMSISEIIDTISLLCEECSVTDDRVTVDFEEYAEEMSLLEIGSCGLTDYSGNILSGLYFIPNNIDVVLDRLNKNDYCVIGFY